MRRGGAADLHLQVPQYSAMAETAANAALRTPSIASSASYTHRPPATRTMSTTSMVSSDGEGTTVDIPFTQAQDLLLSRIYDLELTTYAHANPPFAASAPPPVLLSRVSKRAIKTAGGVSAWPQSLPKTRKHLLLLARRNAPASSSPHHAPHAPSSNPMGVLTDDQPGFFSQRTRQLQQQDGDTEMLHSPFEERTFDFEGGQGAQEREAGSHSQGHAHAQSPGSPRSPRKSSERLRNNQAAAAASSAFLAAHEQTRQRPDLMRAGSFGFGVPLTPKKERRPSHGSGGGFATATVGGSVPMRTIGPTTPRRSDQARMEQQELPLSLHKRRDVHGGYGLLQPALHASTSRGSPMEVTQSTTDTDGSAQGMDKRVAEMMLSPRRSSRLRGHGHGSQPLKRTNSSLSITD